MTDALLLGAGLPLIERLFPPVPFVQQLQQTRLLIVAVLMCCLAAAYLQLKHSHFICRRSLLLSCPSLPVGRRPALRNYKICLSR